MKLPFLLLIAMTGSVCASKLAPLPKWNEADRVKLERGEIIVGQALLTKDGVQTKPAEEPEAAEVLIEAVEEKPDIPGDPLLAINSQIDGVYLERYFADTPEHYLVDPQELLSMQERADLKHVLDTHTAESEVPIYLYLFDEQQQLSEAYEPRRVFEEVFAQEQKPVVLVYYYAGAPERSQFLLAGGAGEQVPEWQVRELLWNAAHKAKEKSDSFAQLENFVGQLSMRLFWVEEILSELTSVEESVVEKTESKVKKPQVREAMNTIWEQQAKPWLPVALCAGVGIACLALLFYLLVASRKFSIPITQSPRRLGGDVGGRFSGILYFKRKDQPPSEQRKQFDKGFF